MDVADERALLLCGMMGAGKSSVGRRLAQRLGWQFIDTDERVEAVAGRTLRAIFEGVGEPHFRALERGVLESLPARRAVIALGGGALVAPANRELLREKGVLVLLDAAPETLAERIGADPERPLLAGAEGGERVERLRALRRERAEAYAGAKVTVSTEGRTLDEVCSAVLEALGRERAA